MSQPLKLRAQDADDLAVISAMLQDALVPLSDMTLIVEERRFVLALNRFRWDHPNPPTRTHALLSVQHVSQVQTKDLDRRNRERILSLLSITYSDNAVLIDFAGGGTLRLLADQLDCALEDVGDPWPAQAVPDHPLD